MDFDILVDNRCDAIKKTLGDKAKEYATDDDRFHNFNVAARKRKTWPEDALMGIKVKHVVSIDDLVEWAEHDPGKLTYKIINAKIGDEINYLVLLEGMLKKRVDGRNLSEKEERDGLQRTIK